MRIHSFSLILCLFGHFFIDSRGKSIPNFAGPYQIVYRRITNVSNEYKPSGKLWVHIERTYHKPGQKQYLWGIMFHGVPFDDSLQLELRLSHWTSNGWKENAFLMKFQHACSDIKRHSPEITEFLHGNSSQKCPIPKGYFIIQNRTVDVIFKAIPVFPYGRYLCNTMLYQGRELVAFASLDLDIIPRL